LYQVTLVHFTNLSVVGRSPLRLAAFMQGVPEMCNCCERLARASRLGALAGMIVLWSRLLCQGNTVTLAWDASTVPDAANYKIYYGVSSGNYTNSVSVGVATSGTVSGLVPGNTYYFAATVTDSAGLESVYSTEVSYTLSTPVTDTPPTLSPLPSLALPENAPLQVVSLQGISSGNVSQPGTLSVTASSSNPGLIPNPTVSYTSPSTSGTLSFTPTAGSFGSSIITVTVNNGNPVSNIVSQSFTITVDQPPTISTISNVVIAVNSQTRALPFTIADAQTDVSGLSVYATASNPGLVTGTNMVLAGTGGSRTITIQPLADQTGTSMITITVSDTIASTSTSFLLSVVPKPAPPTHVRIASQ
jgi:hypothetical protein